MIESREERGKLKKQWNQVAIDGGGGELQTTMAVSYRQRWRRGCGERERERGEANDKKREKSINLKQKFQILT